MKAVNRFLLIIAFMAFALINSQNSLAQRYGLSSDLLDKGDFRYSLYAKAEYGLSDAITISAHPLGIFLAPSVDIKWNYSKNDDYSISILHGISCPTPILSLLAREGTGGVISPEFDIPFMLSIRSGVVSTYKINSEHSLTGMALLELALFNNELEPGSSIDLPVISPRNAVYYKNFGIDLAVSGEGRLSRYFDYYTKAELFLFPFEDDEYDYEYGTNSRYFTELSAMIFWKTSESFKLGIGSKLCYGDYPFGTQWHLLPSLDFVKYVK